MCYNTSCNCGCSICIDPTPWRCCQQTVCEPICPPVVGTDEGCTKGIWDLGCTRYNGEDIDALEIVSGATSGDEAIQAIGEAVAELQVNSSDKLVKIADTDTTAAYLKDKIKKKAGSALILEQKNLGLNEYLELDIPVFEDKLVKISATDTTSGYLIDKLVEGSLIDIIKNTVNGVEKLEIKVNTSALSTQFPTQTPFAGVSSDGIDYTAGGTLGHSPLYKLKLDPATNTALSLGAAGLKLTLPTPLTASSGVEIISSSVKLGGLLERDTLIDSNNYNFNITNSSQLNGFKAGISSNLVINTGNSSTFPQINTALRGFIDFNHTSPVSIYAASITSGVAGEFRFKSPYNIYGEVVASISANSGFSNAGNVEKMASLFITPPRQFTGEQPYIGTIQNYYGIYIVDSDISDITLSFPNKNGIYQAGLKDINTFFGPIVAGAGSKYWRVPKGFVEERPVTGEEGMIRYNKTEGAFEGYTADGWKKFAMVS